MSEELSQEETQQQTQEQKSWAQLAKDNKWVILVILAIIAYFSWQYWSYGKLSLIPGSKVESPSSDISLSSPAPKITVTKMRAGSVF